MTEFERTCLLSLIAAHLLVDFPLQPRRWVHAKRCRGWRSPELYLHAALAGALAALCAQQWRAWWLAPTVATGHLVIDAAKSRASRDTLCVFLLDQAAHVTLLCLVVWLLAGSPLGPVRPGPAFWTLMNAAALVWWAEGIVIDKGTDRWRAMLADGGGEDKGLPDAGLWIGRLERSLILVFVLLGRYEGIGFLIAAKSVFRFGEVTQPRHRREAEYILVGTMGSFLLALLTGVAARRLLFG